MRPVKKINSMKKLIILIIVSLVLTNCATRAHCDAYSHIDDYEQTDSTKSI